MQLANDVRLTKAKKGESLLQRQSRHPKGRLVDVLGVRFIDDWGPTINDRSWPKEHRHSPLSCVTSNPASAGNNIGLPSVGLHCTTSSFALRQYKRSFGAQ